MLTKKMIMKRLKKRTKKGTRRMKTKRKAVKKRRKKTKGPQLGNEEEDPQKLSRAKARGEDEVEVVEGASEVLAGGTLLHDYSFLRFRIPSLYQTIECHVHQDDDHALTAIHRLLRASPLHIEAPSLSSPDFVLHPTKLCVL